MAEEEDNDASSKNAEPKKRPILLILVAVVLVAGAAAAGTILGPKLTGGAPAPVAEPPPAASSAPPADLVKDIVGLAPFIIDSRDADGMIRHVKVAVSIELKEGITDADFRPYVPRGREAAIAYLRSQNFEELTNPARFEEVRAELSKRIIEAVGPSRAGRVLVIDFVGQ